MQIGGFVFGDRRDKCSRVSLQRQSRSRYRSQSTRSLKFERLCSVIQRIITPSTSKSKSYLKPNMELELHSKPQSTDVFGDRKDKCSNVFKSKSELEPNIELEPHSEPHSEPQST